jgi:hypothetical protein
MLDNTTAATLQAFANIPAGNYYVNVKMRKKVIS